MSPRRRSGKRRSTGKSAPTPHPLLEDAWDEFRQFLKDRHARITETRRIVLEGALQRKDHFRADDLAADLTRGASRVSRGTVYRTLALLVQAGIVRELRDSDTHVHYEPVYGQSHHEHLICDSCGAFLEFEDPDLTRHIERACEEHDFQPRTHRVVIFGLCERCRNNRK